MNTPSNAFIQSQADAEVIRQEREIAIRRLRQAEFLTENLEQKIDNLEAVRNRADIRPDNAADGDTVQ